MSGIPPTVPSYPPLPAGSAAWYRQFSGSFVALVLLVAIVVGTPVVIAVHQAGNYFLFSPGTAPVITTSSQCRPAGGELALPDGSPCVHLVVPAGKARSVTGELLMVDVEVSQAGALDWAEWELGLLGKDHEMIPSSEYAGTTPTSELGCQDTQEMLSANQDAALAALSRLGYRVAEIPDGAQLNTVFASSPAWLAGLQCGDTITALNGKPVVSAEALAATLSPDPPGTTVVLTDDPASGGAPKKVKVSLVAPPASALAQGFQGRAYLGVETQDRVKLRLPFSVSVDAGDIGGPSAGLAFTLAILDALSNGRLTGGHKVAATGTMGPTGAVGDVGGVREKTAAVQRAGAQVFFVPEVEYQTAESVADGRLTVVPVTTLSQVLQILHQRYGGDLAGLSRT